MVLKHNIVERFHCVKSIRMRENADQNNSEYGHFSRSVYSAYKQTDQKKCYDWDDLSTEDTFHLSSSLKF